jgi:hypothetical protein
LNEKVAAPVKKTELTAGGSVALTTQHPLSAKFDLADKRRSLGIVRLRTKGHGVFFFRVLVLQILIIQRVFLFNLFSDSTRCLLEGTELI